MDLPAVAGCIAVHPDEAELPHFRQEESRGNRKEHDCKSRHAAGTSAENDDVLAAVDDRFLRTQLRIRAVTLLGYLHGLRDRPAADREPGAYRGEKLRAEARVMIEVREARALLLHLQMLNQL